MCCGGIGGAWWPEPDEDDFFEEILTMASFDIVSAEDLKKECDNSKSDCDDPEADCDNPEYDDVNIYEIFNFLYDNTSIKESIGDCDENEFVGKQFAEFKKNIKGKFLTVKYDYCLIGCAQFDFAEDLGCVYLRNLVIHEHYRRLGLGTHIFNNVKGCIDKKFDKIIIESDFIKNHDGAYEFIKSLKFKEDSDREGAHTYFYDLAADRICKY